MKAFHIGLLAIVVVSIVGCVASKADQNSSPVTTDPKDFSRSVCLTGNEEQVGWKELFQAPNNANELRQIVYKNRSVSDSDPTEIWYEAPGRLLMCSSSGASLCGHATHKFKRDGDQWKDDGGDIVWCDIRRK